MTINTDLLFYKPKYLTKNKNNILHTFNERGKQRYICGLSSPGRKVQADLFEFFA